MRQIKFRAWLVTEHKMINDGNKGSNLISIDHNGNFNITPYKSLCEDSNVIIMQYTGLNDLNGTEVYEGDIVEQPTVMGRIYRYVVEWDNGKGETLGNQLGWILRDHWHTMPLEAYLSPYDDPNKEEYCLDKVIGNIYQNPELSPLRGE